MSVDQKNKTRLGANQWRILEMLQKNKHMTEREIASALYGKPIAVGSHQYIATNRSLHKLFKRNLVQKTTQEIQWSLNKKKKTPKTKTL